MKIISQSANELVLKGGNASGIAIGVVFVVAGVLAGIFLRSSTSMAVWIALALAAVGLAVTFLSSSITVNANRANGQLFYQKKRLIGGQDSTYAIADIFRIETRKQWQIQDRPAGNQGESMPQPVLVWQSVILFKDGRELPLDHQKTSSTTTVGPVVLMGGQGAELAIAIQVAKFLGVPFQEIGPANIGMGIEIGGPGGVQF